MEADRRRWTREEYEQFVATGALDGERVELIDGEIWDMNPIGPDHCESVDRITETMIRRLGDRARVRTQGAIAIGERSEPQPDVLVMARRNYATSHPTTAYLAIEVAASSLKRDRGVKAALYAEAAIPEYWIVNLVDRIVEVRSEIISAAYTKLTSYRSGQSITLIQFPDVTIAVDDVLP
jgi:Uma2 family endonuclease